MAANKTFPVKQIAYNDFVVIGTTMVRLDHIAAMTWDEEVVVVMTNGRCIKTGWKDKEALDAFIAPPAPRGRKPNDA